MVLSAIAMPVLLGSACVFEHRRMSLFSDQADTVLNTIPRELTRAKVHAIMGGTGDKAAFKLKPDIRESLTGESGDRAIFPTDGEAFCHWSNLDPGIWPQCLHVAYDKSDRFLWAYKVLTD